MKQTSSLVSPLIQAKHPLVPIEDIVVRRMVEESMVVIGKEATVWVMWLGHCYKGWRKPGNVRDQRTVTRGNGVNGCNCGDEKWLW